MRNKIESYYTTYDSPIGPLYIINNGLKIKALSTNKQTIQNVNKPLLKNENHPTLIKAKIQLQEYFLGQRTKFSIPLDLSDATEFQKKSWSFLQKIPFGQVEYYQSQAYGLGDINKARAVGSANGKNPILIIIPCHRVIAKNGGLGGFSAGLDKKAYLLQHEGIKL